MPRLFVFSLIFGIAGAVVAGRKGRSWPFWGALCFVFPFLIVLAFVLPPVVASGITKRCPNCGKVVKQSDAVCGHCGKEFPIDMLRCPHCGKFVPQRDHCIECHRSLRGSA